MDSRQFFWGAARHMPSQKIIIVDDHPLFRDALKQALQTCVKGVEIAEADSIESVTKALRIEADADLVLLDLAMPGVQGLAGLDKLRTDFPQVPVVVVSATEDHRSMRRCLDLGASGYIPKSASVETIRAAVSEVLAGGVWAPCSLDPDADDLDESVEVESRLARLTRQQMRVLMMLGEGLLNKQIAYKLGVSEATVKAHVSAILQKLGVDSRTQAVIALGKCDGTERLKPLH